jgi:hypothetical protein
MIGSLLLPVYGNCGKKFLASAEQNDRTVYEPLAFIVDGFASMGRLKTMIFAVNT